MHCPVCSIVSVHSQHTKIVFCRRRNSTYSHKARNHCAVINRKQRGNRTRSIQRITTAAGIKNWLFCSRKCLCHSFYHSRNFTFGSAEFLCKGRMLSFINRRNFWPVFKFYNCSLNITRHIYKNRSRSSAYSNSKSLRNNRKKIQCVFYHNTVLCNRKRQTECICFLKSICSDKGAVDLAGKRNNRNGITAGIGNRSQKIHCTRSACCHTDSRNSGRARHTLCNKTCSLLLSYKNMVYSAFIQFIIQRQNRSAGNSRNGLNSFQFKKFNNYLRTSGFYHSL